MTATETGAVEFDGTDLFLTLSNQRRRYLTSPVINVLDFGAKGDGTTDDAGAIQAAVNSLLSTGGIVYLPASLMYRVNSSIDIRSNFAIWIVSDAPRPNDWQSKRARTRRSAEAISSPALQSPTESFAGGDHPEIARLSAAGVGCAA
jgi:polygalacturonase